ncbi:endochitinase-like [Ornithodoros turicata]|uniref:endochitinase-like n=1 Tax=Ornithodoros turicata TaxID=34597 RepID=UPI003139DEF7
MMRQLAVVLLILQAIHGALTDDDFIKQGGLPVVCYYSGWATTRASPMNYNVEDIPGDLCTHVILAYVGADGEQNDIKSIIPSYANNTRRYKEFANIKNKFLFVKAMVSIGGWEHGGGSLSKVAMNQQTRRAFAKNVVKFLREHNLDGVDIDWRFPANRDRGGSPDTDERNYVELLKELSMIFRGKGLVLTATVPITPFYLNNGYDVAEMVKHVDWLNVLGFDLRGRWNGRTGVHSPLYGKASDKDDVVGVNVEDGIKRLLKLGAPQKKLVLGIPFFGRSFVLADKNQHGIDAPARPWAAIPGPYIGSGEILAYYEICTNIADGIATRVFDNETKCPYAYYDNQWVGYEDEESIGYKMDFVIREGLAGVMVFNNDMDDFQSFCGTSNPLLKKIYEKLAEADDE